MSEFNVINSLARGLDAYQGTKVALLLASRSNFGRTPFLLPPDGYQRDLNPGSLGPSPLPLQLNHGCSIMVSVNGKTILALWVLGADDPISCPNHIKSGYP